MEDWGDDPFGGLLEEENLANSSGLGGISCENCGCNKFYCEDGFFYCEVCLTQSQDTRQIVQREDFTAGHLNAPAVAILREKKAKKNTSKKTEISSWEALNCCLKLMTEKLIELGFPRVLKCKIFQLWTTYLVKRKAIFLSSEDQVEFYKSMANNMCKGTLCGCNQPKKKLPQKRKPKPLVKSEVYDPDNDNTFMSVSQVKRGRSMAKKRAMEKEYMDLLHTSQMEFDQDIQQPTVTGVDAPSTVKFPRKQQCKMTSASKIVSQTMRKDGSQSQLRMHLLLRPEIFNLKSALILIYIASREIGCNLLLTDLIRLSYNGTLQISSLRLMFGENSSKINSSIDRIFISNFLECTNLEDTSVLIEDMINYLGIQSFRYPRYLEFLPKFIDDMVLPREFECLLRQMERIVSIESDNFFSAFYMPPTKVLPEFRILAVIIVGLKLLFGLDDVTERYQSDFAKAVNNIISKYSDDNSTFNTDPSWTKLFDLEDWFFYLRNREAAVQKELFCPTVYSFGHEATSTQINSLINGFGGQKGDNFDRPQDEIKRKSTLNMFSNYSKQRPDSNKVCENVKPYSGMSLPREDIVRQFTSNYPSVNCPKLNPQSLLQCFAKHRIDFVFRPEKYIPLLEKSGYKVKIIKGDARNYKKLTSQQKEDKLLLLFQPYHSFDYEVPFGLGCTGSIKFLLQLCYRTLTGMDDIENKNLQKFGKIVNHISEYFTKFSRVNNLQMSQIFPYDISDSEAEFYDSDSDSCLSGNG